MKTQKKIIFFSSMKTNIHYILFFWGFFYHVNVLLLYGGKESVNSVRYNEKKIKKVVDFFLCLGGYNCPEWTNEQHRSNWLTSL